MSETPDKSVPQPGWRLTPGWVKLLLVLSLSANVAVAGLVGGHALRLWKGEPYRHDAAGWRQPNEPGLDWQQSRILRMVPEARRAEARGILLTRQADLDAVRDEMKAAQEALTAAVVADPFDPEALKQVLEARQRISSRIWTISYEQIAAIAAILTPEERSELADKMDERMRRWMKRGEAKAQ